MNPLSVLIPFEKKNELKLRYKLHWNNESKLWECGNDRIYNMNGMMPYHIEFIPVSFSNKEKAKKLGCKWSPTEKAWYTSMELYENSRTEHDLLGGSNKVSTKTSTLISTTFYDDVEDDEELDS